MPPIGATIDKETAKDLPATRWELEQLAKQINSRRLSQKGK